MRLVNATGANRLFRLRSMCAPSEFLSKGAVRRAAMMLCGLVIGMAIFSTKTLAQVDSGAISGTVRDQSGAVLAGAQVTSTNQGTNLTTSTKSDANGFYTFAPVQIGTYTIATEYQGFEKVIHPDIVVNVQQHVVIDFNLIPGTAVQSVQVTAKQSDLQTENASVGQVVGSAQINNLPLNGRNYFFLAQLAPGVTFSQQD